MKQLFFSSFLLLFLFNFTSIDDSNMKIIEDDPLPCVNKTFPIVIHIVTDSLGNNSVPNIQDNIDSLNILFDPVCMSFSIQEIRIIDNHSYDFINETNEYSELVNLYNKPFRINIYFLTRTGTAIPYLDPGRATYEGIVQAPNLNPAIALDKAAFNFPSNHLAHYMGQYFGLRPTSYDNNGEELVDGSNCNSVGDEFCETPADPLNPNSADFEIDVTYFQNNCRYVYTGKDPNNQFYNPDISNIMSYYVNCRCTFTDGQYRKMANTYLSNPGNVW